MSATLKDGEVACISVKHTVPVVFASAGFAFALAAAGVHTYDDKPIIATGVLDMSTGSGLFSENLGDADRKAIKLAELTAEYTTLIGFPRPLEV